MRATVVTALCCWGIAALGFGIARGALAAMTPGISPVPFAAYSVLIIIGAPALLGRAIVTGIAAVRQRELPDSAHVAVVSAALGLWMATADGSLIWALLSAVAGAVAAAAAVLSVHKENGWFVIVPVLVGSFAAALLWLSGIVFVPWA